MDSNHVINYIEVSHRYLYVRCINIMQEIDGYQ